VVVPKFRHNYDITIPEDLVEEIGRTMEYSNIENKPLKMDVMPVPISHKRNLERLLKNGFSRLLGFSEVFNYSFASEEDNGFEGQKEDSVAILNAMPEEQKFLRNSIYPSLIRNVQSNLDRFGEVKLFEYGRTYHKTEGKELSIEKFWFGFALSKNRKLKENLALLEDDFLQFRSDFEALFLSLAPFTLSFSSYEGEYLHPGAALKILIDNEEIAELGYIHPGKNESFGLKKRIILGKINFHNLLKAYEAYQVKNTFKAPSVYPGGEIDLSFVMEEERSTADLAELVKKQNIEELKSIHVQDIYRGENPGPGKKSVMYRLNLIRYDKTFTSERIQEISNLVIQEATKQGMELRK
ncbi:MAG: phenylalanine--tRNA ligase subunit beta, partial [Leptospiraceae bacterium]|nr:phenylalanine--tRNA ligase subunit beta [Leptospiraceae bacterium]